MRKKYDVFISHSNEDKVFSSKLVSRLKDAGISVFHEELCVASEANLVKSISQAIQNSEYVIAVMSPEYFKSQWSIKELEIGLTHEFKSNELKVIPLLYRDVKIPDLLNTKTYGDVRTDSSFENTFPQIISLLGGKKVEFNKSIHKAVELGLIKRRPKNEKNLTDKMNELSDKINAFSKSPVLSRGEAKVEVDPSLCFVVMPFSPDELTEIYDCFVKPSIERGCNLRCERGDDMFGSNVVMDDIRQSIGKARIVIADLTDRNSNVFYEIGIAHALNKDVLLISQSMDDIPFDLRHLRVLIYNSRPRGLRDLELSIVENVNALINNEKCKKKVNW
ncbi:MAG: toll/interleukin-1 receptor domain-containing protein [Bermanella sp.]